MKLTQEITNKYYKFKENKDICSLIIGVMHLIECPNSYCDDGDYTAVIVKSYYVNIGNYFNDKLNDWNDFSSITVTTEYFKLNDEYPRDFSDCTEITENDYTDISNIFKTELSKKGVCNNISNKINNL